MFKDLNRVKSSPISFLQELERNYVEITIFQEIFYSMMVQVSKWDGTEI